MTIKLKVGRSILDISEKDIIIDNGACYQIITQKIGFGFNKKTPVVSKKLFKELKELNFIYTNSELPETCREIQNAETSLTAYKFNVEAMKKCGYSSSIAE